MRINPDDDLGMAQPPQFRVVACLAVLGRLPLLELTIRRLYEKNGCYKVICAGHDPKDREVCERAGAVWVQARNNPLGFKWNKSFEAARQFDPDACLFVGSSDWLSDNWIPIMRPYLESYDLVGVPGMHLLHVCEDPLLCCWPGYINQRRGESIGIGRMLGRQLLDRIQFKPFKERLESSLDNSMQDISSIHAARIHLVDNKNIVALSLSTNLWPQKHKFADHYLGILPSKKLYNVEEFLLQNFPEALELIKSLCTLEVRSDK